VAAYGAFNQLNLYVWDAAHKTTQNLPFSFLVVAVTIPNTDNTPTNGRMARLSSPGEWLGLIDLY